MGVKQEHRRRRGERRRRQMMIWYVLGGAIVLVVIVLAVSALVSGANGSSSGCAIADGEYHTTDSGLQYRIIEEGEGPCAQPGDTVAVLYTGMLEDGTVFDASEQHGGQPIEFVLGTGGVIPGWDEGIALLNEGGKAELIIPPDLGYGAQDYGPIPGNSTLTFEVELVAINP